MKYSFAQYYHELVFDKEGYQSYLNWVIQDSTGKHFLECACGTGYLSHLLGRNGYSVDALDIDQGMIDLANQDNKHENVNFFCLNMFDLSSLGLYDSIIIFLDSLNYCKDEYELRSFFSQAYNHLNDGGILLFDLHHPNRLNEFSEEYIEEGVVLGNYYHWSIQTIGTDKIHHNIVVYENDSMFVNRIEQTVFSIDIIESILKELSFEFERVLTFSESEFDIEEKLYYRARKG